MYLFRLLLVIAFISSGCGYQDESVSTKSPKVKSSDGSGVSLTEDELNYLSRRLLSIGAYQLRRESGEVYYEQSDPQILLMVKGVREVFGDFGLPSYDEQPKCNENGQCGPETEYSVLGWNSFWRDFFKGMDRRKIDYMNHGKIDTNKVLEFALKGG